jgi:hypothetical protein
MMSVGAGGKLTVLRRLKMHPSLNLAVVQVEGRDTGTGQAESLSS